MRVQYKSEPLSIPSERRRLLYRKDPSELSLWNRLFRNPWKYFYTAYRFITKYDKTIDDLLCTSFSLEEAKGIINKYDTYEKLVQFLDSEYNIAKSELNECLKQNGWDF